MLCVYALIHRRLPLSRAADFACATAWAPPVPLARGAARAIATLREA